MQKPYYFLASGALFFLASFLLFQFNTGDKTEYSENKFDDITTVVFEGEDPIKVTPPFLTSQEKGRGHPEPQAKDLTKKQKPVQVSKIAPVKKEMKIIKPQLNKKIIVQKIKPQIIKKMIVQKTIKPLQQLITANNIEEIKLRPLKATREDIKLRGL